VCAVRATSASDIVQVVVSSAVPLSQPSMHRFGGAVIHAPFWKRAQRLDFAKLRGQAQDVGKMLLLCGHSIGASIAQLAFCELVYGGLPHSAREVLETMDAEQANADGKEPQQNEPVEWMARLGDDDRESVLQTLPAAMAVAFGAPFAGNAALNAFLLPLGLNDRVVTFVNEFDCIPGILNVAHSAAVLARTAEGLVTTAKATESLLNLLPTPMQQRIADMVKGTGSAAVPSTTSAYISMSITRLRHVFDTLREFIAKSVDYRYAPLGTFVFMAKENAEFHILSDPVEIRRRLGEDGGEPAPGLTGNSILQHMMSAYVESIARRSKFTQINATMTHYQRLGVARNATHREISISYRSLSLKWHPDRMTRESFTDQEKERAEDIFKLVAESYAVLEDKESRRAYDAYLNRPPSRREEFVRYGTVGGMTLLEAISLFEKAVDNVSSTVHSMTGRFISSSSTTLQSAGKAPAAATASCEQATSSSGVPSLSAKLPVTSDSASASAGVAAVPDPTGAAHQVSSGAPTRIKWRFIVVERSSSFSFSYRDWCFYVHV
jgi:curved DNA-binding protein CbpA